MKKAIYILGLLNLLPFIANAQAPLEVKYKTIGNNFASCPVILPSMENLITLVNCNADQFKTLMNKYNYYPKEDYVGTNYCYDNWGLDLWMYGNDGKGANTYTYSVEPRVVVCDIVTKMLWPTGYIADWHNSMRQYLTKTEELSNMYLYETSDAYYGFMLQKNANGTAVQISVKKFLK